MAKKVRTYRIRIIIEVPDNISYQDLREWAEFKTHYRGGINPENPLYKSGQDLDPIQFSMGAMD